MKQLILTIEQNKCLRECLKTIETILDGRGLILGGVASERKAVKKEPTQRERVKNYADVLNMPHQKPKHLKK